MSKAHASPALYVALALRGFFPEEKIYEYCEPGGLDGHDNEEIVAALHKARWITANGKPNVIIAHTFEWGKGITILKEKGVNAEVIHLASIKPIDRKLILKSVSKTKCAVTAENASVNGGFGDAVLEVIAEENPVPVKKIGVKDQFIETGDIPELKGKKLGVVNGSSWVMNRAFKKVSEYMKPFGVPVIQIADAIRETQKKEKIDIVVLAQLSMSVFSFSYPYSEREFGINVLNSGETGILKAASVLKKL